MLGALSYTKVAPPQYNLTCGVGRVVVCVGRVVYIMISCHLTYKVFMVGRGCNKNTNFELNFDINTYIHFYHRMATHIVTVTNRGSD